MMQKFLILGQEDLKRKKIDTDEWLKFEKIIEKLKRKFQLNYQVI